MIYHGTAIGHPDTGVTEVVLDDYETEDGFCWSVWLPYNERFVGRVFIELELEQ